MTTPTDPTTPQPKPAGLRTCFHCGTDLSSLPNDVFCPKCLPVQAAEERRAAAREQRVETPAAEPAETNANVVGSCAGSSPASLSPQPQGGTPEVDAAIVYCDLMTPEDSPVQYADMVPVDLARTLAHERNEARAARAAADGADSLAKLQREAREWADATFPHSDDRARLKHIEKEVQELLQEPADGEEMADILLILSHHAHRHGVDLLSAARAKFEKCKLRKWGKPDADGVCQHISEGDAALAAKTTEGGV